MVDSNKSMELVLSILLAVALSQSLNLFISLPKTKTWLITSILILVFTITLVYFILNLKLNNKYRDLTRIATIILFVFLPFSYQRTFITSDLNFIWNLNYFFLHITIMGVLLLTWGHAESKISTGKTKSLALYITGIFTIAFGLLAFAWV